MVYFGLRGREREREGSGVEGKEREKWENERRIEIDFA
jgi:hypothetical protein